MKSAVKIHLKSYVLLLLAAIGCPSLLSAQNTFPSTGPVGIGTTAPSSMLSIRPYFSNAFDIHPASLSTSTGEFRLRELTANGTHYVGFKAPSSIGANQIWILPNTAGTTGQVLARSSGSSLVWSTVPSLSLNNLSTTSVNVDLRPNTNGTRSLGSSSLRWKDLWLSGEFRTAGGITANTIYLESDMYASPGGETILSFNPLNNNLSLANARIPNSSSENNIFIGSNAGNQITSGSLYDNICIGTSAGQSLNQGNVNTIVGTFAGVNVQSGSGNTLLGFAAGEQISTGFDNTIIGMLSGTDLSNGSNNAFLGREAGNRINGGSNNVCIGYGASPNIATAYNAIGLTLLGANAQTNGAYTNAAAIGNGAVVTASNRIRLGNTSITRISGQVGFSIDSDLRLKQNVKDYELGLDFINQLRPVSYEYKNNPDGGNRQGFIAQEVEQALGDIPFEGLSKPEHEEDFYAINYSAFVVPLVGAVKELTAKIKELENELELLKQTSKNMGSASLVEQSKLGQNEPNPFSDFTRINYAFEKVVNEGKIVIIDLNGRTLRTYEAHGKSGSVIINKGELSAGVYTYLLFNGNELVSAKQMVVN